MSKPNYRMLLHERKTIEDGNPGQCIIHLYYDGKVKTIYIIVFFCDWNDLCVKSHIYIYNYGWTLDTVAEDT